MHPILRNILAVLAGLLVGNLVNGGLVSVGPSIIPVPEGIDPNDMESMAKNFHLLKPKNFIIPFLAHALGTLAGAFITAILAASHRIKLALVIGGFFFIGGILVNFVVLTAPLWFAALDLIIAYFPMAYLGGKLGSKKKR